MSAWFVVVLGAVAMAAFGFFVAHLFDSISQYTNAWAPSPEDSSANKERERS